MPPLVVYYDHVGRLSGAEISMARLIDALVQEELVRAHVILCEDGDLVDALRRSGATVEVLPLAPQARDMRREGTGSPRALLGVTSATARHTLALARRFRRLEPDLVHTNSMKAHLLGGAAARLAGVPQLWHAHDRLANDYLPRRAVQALRAAVRTLPTRVVANSEETLATLRLPAGRGRVLPSPLPAGWPESVRQADPGRAGPALVGVVGRLTPWKGQDLFLRAFAAAHPGTADRAMVVGSALFGEAAYEAELHGLCDTLGLGDRVTFTGQTEDVAGLLAECTVLVHCSRIPEPFGQVVIEGMAVGLPVVAADAGGPAECLRHEITGLLTPMGDAAALAGALRRLARHPELRARLGTAARSAAEAYRAVVIAPHYAELYADIVNHRYATR